MRAKVLMVLGAVLAMLAVAAPAQAIKGVKAVLPVVNAGGEVRYEGQPVAAVAATTAEAAHDAMRAIVVEYEELPHAVSFADATKEGAPVVVKPVDGSAQRGVTEVRDAGRLIWWTTT